MQSDKALCKFQTGIEKDKARSVTEGLIFSDFWKDQLISSKLHIHFLLSLGNLPLPNHFLSNSTLWATI